MPNTNDPAARRRALAQSIAAKSARRPQVDSQGRIVEQGADYRVDDEGLYDGPAKR
ncbi:hypothetical protein [Nocardioides sp. YIM 152588]|uniref:hypothetical protein n=1 Tax=Nocardioides sp. YIM 152588 TaxID=3158259 RepID=UPI0032E42AC1